LIPNQEFEGYKMIGQIVEEKRNQVLKNKLPLSIVGLIGKLNNYFKSFEVLDECYLPFPAYSISVHFTDNVYGHIKVSSYIRVKISLLTNHFTVFYEDVNYFENFSKVTPMVFRIFSSLNKAIDQEKDYFNSILMAVQRHFPSYVFVNHRNLFTSKVNGVPYNQLQDERNSLHSVYDFLFDNEYSWGTLEVTF
jgi:hypothetical protein